MTTLHLIALSAWLILTSAAATAFAITRHRYAWWALVALCLPLAGAAWVLTLSSRRTPPNAPAEDTAPGLEEETWPDPPPPIQLPKDHTTKEDRHVPPPPPPDDADRDADLDWYRKRTDALRDD
jgi:hypothetical protein